MNQSWDVDEIIHHFTLVPPEVTFLGDNDPHNHLGKALLLKFFQCEGRFPESKAELPPATVEYVAQQLKLSAEVVGSNSSLKPTTTWSKVAEPVAVSGTGPATSSLTVRLTAAEVALRPGTETTTS